MKIAKAETRWGIRHGMAMAMAMAIVESPGTNADPAHAAGGVG